MPHLRIFWPQAFAPFRRSGGGWIDFPLARRRSIKDIAESLGAPHTEIGAITVDGAPVGFEFIPERSHEVVLQPVSAPFDVTRPSRLRPRALTAVRFIADVNVGKLAALLRTLGMDTAYDPQMRDRRIAAMAEAEGRIVLTKDVMLLKRGGVAFGRYVRSVHPDDQLREVVRFFGLGGAVRPFRRCIRCNAELVPVEKADIVHRLEPKTKRFYHRFRICECCDRIYWRGSHHEAMVRRIREALEEPYVLV